jgi:cell division protein FtsB
MEKRIKSKSEKGILFKVLLVFLLLVVLVLIIGTVREFFRQKDLDKELLALEAEIEKLKLDKNHFLNSIEVYQSDFFVEQEARLKFNLQKPGEKVLVIPSSELNGQELASGLYEKGQVAVGVNYIYVNNLRAWWNYFFHTLENN